MEAKNMFRIKRVLFIIPVILTSIAVGSMLMAQDSNSALRSEADLLGTLQSAEASIHDKAVACKQLAVVGTKQSVPVLAGLLSDERLSYYARFGLEPIPDPSVDEALRDALDKVEGKLLIGVINSIGNRRDSRALGRLGRLLRNSDKELASAAASALGRIGTARTAMILRNALRRASPSLRPAIADACLVNAEQLTKEANALYDAVKNASVPGYVKDAANEALKNK
jgi:HEAT repeat protein